MTLLMPLLRSQAERRVVVVTDQLPGEIKSIVKRTHAITVVVATT